jgi:hypothetical protein
MLVPRTGVMLHVMVKVTCRSPGGTHIYDKVGLRHILRPSISTY